MIPGNNITHSHKIGIFLNKLPVYCSFCFLILLALLPTIQIILRTFFQTGIPGITAYTAHLVLGAAFMAGIVTAYQDKHLALKIGLELLSNNIRTMVEWVTAFISAAICIALGWSSLALIIIGFSPAQKVGIFPLQFVAAIMPLGFFAMAIHFALSNSKLSGKLIGAGGLLAGTLLALSSFINVIYHFVWDPPLWVDRIWELYYLVGESLSLPLFFVLVVSAFFGVPLFIVLGGAGYILFAGAWGVLEVIPNEAYVMLTGNAIPAIPLFTLAGFILTESKAGERLVHFFRALFGWIPGGLVVVTVLVCAFFTTFTGASGVTILALGGLLSLIMVESGDYSKKFSNGLITSSGSIGLLFPPSLPIILYGVVAGISIKDMFIGGIIPGIIMILTLSIYGLIITRRQKPRRTRFSFIEAKNAFLGAIWEILLPVIILAGYFLGVFTLVESGAIAVMYTIFVEVVVHRDISVKELPAVVGRSVPIIGGVLVILAASRGLGYYIIDAQIPMIFTFFVESHIQSRLLFLILLNLALLLTGCLMDIYSAIMVVVPLIIPFSTVFNIHPVHLGIIFLANLELGYLTPPVGLNLFLASYRFDQPLSKIYRMVLPFFMVRIIAVLLITYVSWFTLVLIK